MVAVVSGRNAPPILGPVELDLDAVAMLAAAFVVPDGSLSVFSAGDACPYPLVFQCISAPVGAVAPIGQHSLCLRQAARHASSTGVITDWARGGEHANRAALRIGNATGSFVFMPPLVRPLRRPRPLFQPRAEGQAMGFQISRVDHDRLIFGGLSRQTVHHSGEYPKSMSHSRGCRIQNGSKCCSSTTLILVKLW